MAVASNLTIRRFCLPAFRTSGLRQRGASRLHQPGVPRRRLERPPPPPPSSSLENKHEPSPTSKQGTPSAGPLDHLSHINKSEVSPAQAEGKPLSTPSISSALGSISASENNLLAPIYIPEDPNAVLKENHPATSILANSGLVVQRQIEMMNLLLGFEQANRYIIMDPQGNHVGYMAEHEGFGKAIGRQWLGTHRAFTTHIFNKEQKEVLRVCDAPNKLPIEQN
jgi:Scramblase